MKAFKLNLSKNLFIISMFSAKRADILRGLPIFLSPLSLAIAGNSISLAQHSHIHLFVFSYNPRERLHDYEAQYNIPFHIAAGPSAAVNRSTSTANEVLARFVICPPGGLTTFCRSHR